MDALPDFNSLSDDDLERLLRGTEEEEDTISRRRRRLHERIDALRAERVERLRGQVAAGTLELLRPTRSTAPSSREPAIPPPRTRTSSCPTSHRSPTTSCAR